jgi:hypothetical protein
MSLHAILNADIIGSTGLSEGRRDFYFSELKKLFEEIKKKKNAWGITKAFEIYRGDSFQGALDKPEMALKLALLLRVYLRMISGRYREKTKRGKKKSPDVVTDMRIAIGIGALSKLGPRLLESDGEAFQRSGKLIDSMKKSGQNLALETPWGELNESFEVIFGLLDAIISRWSPLQSEVIYLSLLGLTQTQIAEKVNTSIPAISQRLKTANWYSVDKLLAHFEAEVKKKSYESVSK